MSHFPQCRRFHVPWYEFMEINCCRTWCRKLIIYPKGDDNIEGNDYISVYLAIANDSSLPAGWEANAVFSFFLFNQLCDNYLVIRDTYRLTFFYFTFVFFPFPFDRYRAFSGTSMFEIFPSELGRKIFVMQCIGMIIYDLLLQVKCGDFTRSIANGVSPSLSLTKHWKSSPMDTLSMTVSLSELRYSSSRAKELVNVCRCWKTSRLISMNGRSMSFQN